MLIIQCYEKQSLFYVCLPRSCSESESEAELPLPLPLRVSVSVSVSVCVYVLAHRPCPKHLMEDRGRVQLLWMSPSAFAALDHIIMCLMLLLCGLLALSSITTELGHTYTISLWESSGKISVLGDIFPRLLDRKSVV